MRIDIWSDVVCPWCSIGKCRLERALADFPHRDDVEVVFHSFLLDPAAPRKPSGTVAEMLAQKYGLTVEQAIERQGMVIALAAELGMDWSRHRESPHVGTADAHRLLHLALAEGGPALQSALKDALLHAYFGEARNVADHEVLRQVASSVGLDGERVATVLGSDEYAAAVAADVAQAQAYGANGVPFFVVDEKYAVSGAQPVELFAQLLDRAWSERRPTLETVPGTEDADACGPDGCAV